MKLEHGYNYDICIIYKDGSSPRCTVKLKEVFLELTVQKHQIPWSLTCSNTDFKCGGCEEPM